MSYRYNKPSIPVCMPVEPPSPVYPSPGFAPPRPEPYYGTLKIVEARPTDDQRSTAVRYADGRYDVIPNACVLEPGTVTHNGPRCLPWDDVRGDISNSEGMDFINYAFNNSDCGATF
jgi:hypothetical protein